MNIKSLVLIFLLLLAPLKVAHSSIFSWLFGDDNSIPEMGLNFEAQIKFNSGTSKLAQNSALLLNKIGKKLVEIETYQKNRGTKIHLVIEAHTDNKPPKKCKRYKKSNNRYRCSVVYNTKLSHDRAARVANYLKNNFGFRRSQLSIRGLGFRSPKIKGKKSYTAEGRRQNRRVRIIVTKVIEKTVDL